MVRFFIHKYVLSVYDEPDTMPRAKATKARDTSFLPFWSSHCSRAYSPTEEPGETHMEARQVVGCSDVGNVPGPESTDWN